MNMRSISWQTKRAGFLTQPVAVNAVLRGAARRLDGLSDKLEGMAVRTDEDKDQDLRRFIENLKIVNKRGEWTPLLMNRSQERILDMLMEQRERRKPARFICLKARQMGVSTLIEAFIFALVFHRANRNALVAAHSLESARTIFSIARRFLRFLPDGRFGRKLKAATGLIEFPSAHNSRMRVGTANDRTLGRGGVIHYVHASEAAFWRRPDEPIAAINQSVPLHWDTMVFWESTANGMNNLFHRTWIEAERGESDMTPIFLPWTEFPEYSLPTTSVARTPLTTEEAEYSKRVGLNEGQAAWARYVRINQCHGSWNKFHQEYPAEAGLAFMFTGMPWFDPVAISAMISASAEMAHSTGLLTRSPHEADGLTFREEPAGPLTVWKRPEPGRSYSLGMDVGEGVGGDYTVVQVICDDTGDTVARYRSNRVRPETAAIDACRIGAWYNYGLLGVERNGPGLAVLGVCERGDLSDPATSAPYPNLYYHVITDRRLLQETARLGWLTTRASKEAMLSRLAQAVEEGDLTVFTKTTLMEMQGFVWDAETRSFRQQWASPDSRLAHDDEIMALAIANEMRIMRPGRRFMEGRPSPEGIF